MRWISLLAVYWIMGFAVSACPQNKSRAIPKDPPDSNPQYFPVGVFQDSSESGWFQSFKERWYAKHLRSMHEPSLSEVTKDKTLVVYRFLWLRTFHNPVAIRLTIHVDGTGTLTGKVTNGKGGYDAGSLILNESHEITKVQVAEFLDLLRKAAFWSSPTEESTRGLDGAQWILEGFENGRYHIVDRWSPAKSDYARTCLYLLELSEIKVGPKEIY